MRTLTAEQFDKMVADNKVVETFTRKTDIQINRDLINKIKENPEPYIKDGATLESVRTLEITGGRGKYAVVYEAESTIWTTTPLDFEGLEKESEKHYVGNEFYYEYENLRLTGKNTTVMLHKDLGTEEDGQHRYYVGVQTASFGNKNVDFIAKYVADLENDVNYAQRLKAYLKDNNLLAERDYSDD